MIEIKPICRFRLRDLEPGAKEFYASSKHLHAFDIGRFVAFWKNVIEAQLGIIIVAIDDGEIIGAIAGMVVPEPYSAGTAVHEFFWFVRPGHRGTAGVRLYKAFEKWARDKNATVIRMVHLLDSMPEKLERFYGAMGYTAVETLYSKDLAA